MKMQSADVQYYPPQTENVPASEVMTCGGKCNPSNPAPGQYYPPPAEQVPIADVMTCGGKCNPSKPAPGQYYPPPLVSAGR